MRCAIGAGRGDTVLARCLRPCVPSAGDCARDIGLWALDDIADTEVCVLVTDCDLANTWSMGVPRPELVVDPGGMNDIGDGMRTGPSPGRGVPCGDTCVDGGAWLKGGGPRATGVDFRGIGAELAAGLGRGDLSARCSDTGRWWSTTDAG